MNIQDIETNRDNLIKKWFYNLKNNGVMKNSGC